jgi:hypothetical protein
MNVDVHIDRTQKNLTRRKYVLSVDNVEIRKLPSPQNNRAEIKATIHFYGGSILHFFEIVETGKCYPQILKYSYHYNQGDLQIFRYDDAPDHRDLPTFPHHKHIVFANNERIQPADQPTHDNLFEEIIQIIECQNVL